MPGDEHDPPADALSSDSALLRRAHAALVDAGGPLAAAELQQVVFGANGPVWLALLERMLQGSEIFARTADGTWSLAHWNAEGLDLASVEFVVFDIETTGLSAARHRMIEVGALLVQNGQVRSTFSQLINPERRIPDFISRFTGISSEMVVKAPLIKRVMPDLLQFIGRRPVVGHNVSFDLSFLNAEAERLGLFAPSAGIDTIPLARRLVPGVRRLKLDALAMKLGVPVRERHRALGDAQTTADVFEQLLVRARQAGCHTLGDLYALLDAASADRVPSRGAVAQPRPSGNMYLNPAWKRDFPEKPGVYLMHDAQDTVIYVGKAKSLKQRLASYYNHPLGYTRKMDGLLQSVQRIEIRVLGSELEALLVESQLIKALQPRYNVQLRNYELYPFIKIDIQAEYPRVSATREVRADGSKYFGPFNSRRAVDATIEVIQKLFSIRTCTRTLPPAAKPSDPCLRYHMGRCPAPCRGNVSRASYHAIITEVVDFLANSRGDLMDALRDKMWQAAERDDFERAAALRDIISHADHVLLGQQLLTGAVEANNLLLVYPSAQPGHAEMFLVRHGRLVEQRAAPCDPDAIAIHMTELIRRALWLGPPPTRVGKAEVDQINIIARWVHRYSSDQGRAFFTLPANLDDPAVQTALVQAVIARTLALAAGEEQLVLEAIEEESE
jgi:DNA polymerase III subunit epsilon